MTTKKQVKQVLISFIVMCFLVNCVTSSNTLSGEWKLVSAKVFYADHIELVKETAPKLFEKKIKALIPFNLKVDDILLFTDSKIVQRKKSYKYKLSNSLDSIIYINLMDSSYPVTFEVDKDTLKLSRSVDQGSIVYFFEKLK